MTFRNRGFGIVFGAATFGAAHSIEVAMWARWFGAVHTPWFLNSGTAVAFTVGWLFALSLIGGALGLSGPRMLAGAAAAMATVLIWIGQTTLFPIALAIGVAFAAFSCLLGGWVGKEVRALGRTRSDS